MKDREWLNLYINLISLSIRSYYIQFTISIFSPYANMKLRCGK